MSMKLTDAQMKNVALLNGATSEDAKKALFLMGLEEILLLKAQRTENSGFRTLALKYMPMIREYLKR